MGWLGRRPVKFGAEGFLPGHDGLLHHLLLLLGPEPHALAGLLHEEFSLRVGPVRDEYDLEVVFVSD